MKLAESRIALLPSPASKPSSQKPILKYLRDYAGGEPHKITSRLQDHDLARRLLEEERLCWFSSLRQWQRLDRNEWTPVCEDEVHHCALSFLERLSALRDENLDPKLKLLLEIMAAKKPDLIFQRANRLVRCAKNFSEPPAQTVARTEEFIRQWLARDKINPHSHVAVADLWKLYEVARTAEAHKRGKRVVCEDFAVAIKATYGMGRSHNLPHPTTGKQRRGWWGLRWARPLPEGFNDSDE